MPISFSSSIFHLTLLCFRELQGFAQICPLGFAECEAICRPGRRVFMALGAAAKIVLVAERAIGARLLEVRDYVVHNQGRISVSVALTI